jgi:HTH-type transcriptional regulator/antitoxin MqsA
MSETRIHPETGQELRRDTRPQTVCVGSLSRVVEVPGWYPEGDGDAIHSGEICAPTTRRSRNCARPMLPASRPCAKSSA